MHDPLSLQGPGDRFGYRESVAYAARSRVCACVYALGRLIMGTTGAEREYNAHMEGRKFAISTRARHVSGEPSARLTNSLSFSVSNAFLFPFVAFPNGKF